MQILDKEQKYLDYLKTGFQKYLIRPGTYIYGVICIIGLGLYWYQDGLMAMTKVFFLLTSAFSITFLISEIFGILATREIKRNKLVTLTCATILLLTIVIIFFDDKVRYWSIALGLVLFIPVLIVWIITKIRLRF